MERLENPSKTEAFGAQDGIPSLRGDTLLWNRDAVPYNEAFDRYEPESLRGE